MDKGLHDFLVIDELLKLREFKENIKFGYLRRDNDAHWYLIPEELIKEFDADFSKLFEEYPEDYRKLLNEWNDKWWKYSYGESIYSLKVVIDG